MPPLQATLARLTLPPCTSLLLGADRHGAAGDGLVLAGLEIAEDEGVVRRELDDLAGADIVHEFDVGGGAVDVLHQRNGDQRGRSLRPRRVVSTRPAASAAPERAVLIIQRFPDMATRP